ncbi:MAG TPA: tetratricopeptide repeat protein [Terriglobales bacterium]|nr:tetratricopeptide repeat protein [Terriglobales bacterium]
MRIVTPSCCVLLLVAGLGTPALADVIHLKNGDVIYADEAKDIGTKIQYQKGDDVYSIPKSRVESIEKSDAPVVGPATNLADLPIAPPSSASTAGEQELLNQIAGNGHVNREALREIERRGNAPQTAIAYYIAGKQEFQSGDYNSSKRDFEMALQNDPRNPAILNFYAALLLKTGNPRDALLYAEHAVQEAPDSADAYAVLGYAQFATDHNKDAIQSWKKSIALRPDTSIQQMIARAQRENSTEGNFSQHESGHFSLHYEGTQSSESLRGQIISTLESAYQDLSREFASEPRQSIEVILYTGQDYFDVTRAPSWTGALNDGKIRIPLRGVNYVSSDMARVLRHELTHSFVNQATQGRCPTWLNEGIAQMLEPRSLGPLGSPLARLFKSEQEVPLNVLEGGFMGLSTPQAQLAYAEALATTEYIRDRYGMSDIMRILQRLGQGDSTESALRSTIHCDYRELQEETGTALVQQFGG